MVFPQADPIWENLKLHMNQTEHCVKTSLWERSVLGTINNPKKPMEEGWSLQALKRKIFA